MIEQNDPHGTAQSDSLTYEREPDEPPSLSVIRAVAAVNETDPTRMRPLYEAIDPDALDHLFASTSRRSTPLSHGFVSFRYGDCDVTVYGDGRTVVSPDD